MRQHPLAGLSASNRSKKPTEVIYYNSQRRIKETLWQKHDVEEVLERQARIRGK